MVCHSIHLTCSIFANLAARPGRVVGSVIPYENGNVADPNNVRRVARNPVVPPVTSNQSTHCNHLMPDCSCRQQHQNELEKDRVQYRSRAPTHGGQGSARGRRGHAVLTVLCFKGCAQSRSGRQVPPGEQSAWRCYLQWHDGGRRWLADTAKLEFFTVELQVCTSLLGQWPGSSLWFALCKMKPERRWLEFRARTEVAELIKDASVRKGFSAWENGEMCSRCSCFVMS
jgi:hypothetical protein